MVNVESCLPANDFVCRRLPSSLSRFLALFISTGRLYYVRNVLLLEGDSNRGEITDLNSAVRSCYLVHFVCVSVQILFENQSDQI